MLTPKQITSLAAALPEMVLISLDAPKEESYPNPCRNLIYGMLSKNFHELAIEIAETGGYSLDAFGLVLTCYKGEDGKEDKVVIRGFDYGRYPITGPKLNGVLVKYELQEEKDSAGIGMSRGGEPLSLNPIIGRRKTDFSNI